MKNKITAIVLVIFTLLIVKSQAQIKDTLLVFTKFENNQVKIKIAPQKVQTWLKGVENGYQISRFELGVDKSFKVLNDKPLKPFLKKSDFDGMPNGDTLYGFNKKVIAKTLNESKMERSAFETMSYYEKLQNDYGFYYLIASRMKVVSQISGLEFIDKTAKEGKEYIYKIEMLNNTKYYGVSAIKTFKSNPVIPTLKAKKLDKKVILNWARHESSNFLCYNIEKSIDGVNFTKQNKAPLYYDKKVSEQDTSGYIKQDFFTYIDSLNENYKTYHYRLVGIDIWADEYTSDFVLKTNGIDKTAPVSIQTINHEIDKEKKNIKYFWDYSPPADCAGIELFVSNEIFKKYKKLNVGLLGKETTSYLLENVVPGNNYYFKIAVWDTVGNYSFSEPVMAFLPDIYPPSAPKNIKTNVDKNGKLVLSWDKNPEEDIRAYRVYTSHEKGNKMIAPISELIYDTVFNYQLNMAMLNKHRCFTVAAIDMSYNYSDNSDTVQVSIPDTIGPSSAFIKEVIIEDNSATLNWIPSTSKDVKTQILYRRIYDKGEWEKIKELNAKEKNYKEPELQVNAYQYSIIAVDSSGNIGSRSNLKSFEIKKKPTEILITDFDIKTKKSKVQLSWNSTGDEAKFYIVYRQSSNDFKKLASVDSKKFEDVSVKEGIAYKYYIVAQDKKGKLHKKSKIKKVRL